MASNRLLWQRASWLALLVAAALVFAGCGVSVHKDEKGDNKKVDISSPFGSLHVNTDVDLKTLGLPVYPGAQQRHDRDHDKHSANVNIDSSLFGVKVVAAEFESNDSPEQVLDYYRKALKSYGNVIECQGRDRGQHARPGESKELTCGDDDRGGARMSVSMLKDHRDATELKVGTTDKQHIVAVRTEGGKTRFGLVFLQTRGSHDSI
jgi:hypothetical protein